MLPGVSLEGSHRLSGTSLEDAVRDFYAALARDDAGWVDDVVAPDDATLVIGTDSAEWTQGFEAIREMWVTGREANGGTVLHPRRLAVHEQGEFGWAVDEPDFEVGSDHSGVFRLTMLFVRRSGRWLLLHLHASVGVPNDTLLSGGEQGPSDA